MPRLDNVGATEPAAGEDNLNLLLVACAQGDREAARRIYELTSPSLLGIAMRLVRRRDLAEDVLHDAFVQIWQRARTFNPAQGTAHGWIIAIVRYRALDVLRRGSRRQEDQFESEVEALADPGPTALERLSEYEELAKLRQCVEGLTRETRQCILLAYSDGYTHEEIAARLERPLGTVKSWIRRGLLALRSCLQS